MSDQTTDVAEPEAEPQEAGEPAVAAPPAPRPPETAQPGIRATDRVLCLGPTGSGKSVLLNYLWSVGPRCQRLLLDTKDEFTIPGVEPVSKLGAIDWDQPVIHYIDDRGDLREYDRLFRLLMQRRLGRTVGPRNYGIVVCVHEAGDLCGDQPGATPQWVSAYVRKMRAHGGGLYAGSQRPVNMPKVMRTETQHVFAMVADYDPDDRPVVAKCLRVGEHQLEQLLDQARDLSPTREHSFLWFDKRMKTISIRPPLPPELRQQSVVRGLDDG